MLNYFLFLSLHKYVLTSPTRLVYCPYLTYLVLFDTWAKRICLMDEAEVGLVTLLVPRELIVLSLPDLIAPDIVHLRQSEEDNIRGAEPRESLVRGVIWKKGLERGQNPGRGCCKRGFWQRNLQ